MISTILKNIFKIMLLLLIPLLFLGCSIIFPEKPIQPDQPTKKKETNNVNANKIEQKPAIVIPPLKTTTETLPTQNNKEKDLVQEAYERYQQQRDMDQAAKQAWWESVHNHQKEIIKMNQDFQMEMSNTN